MNEELDGKISLVQTELARVLDLLCDMTIEYEYAIDTLEFEPNEYDDDDLFNATKIFSHLLFNRAYFRMKGKATLKEKEVLVVDLGNSIRELVKTWTGKDTHKLV